MTEACAPSCRHHVGVLPFSACLDVLASRMCCDQHVHGAMPMLVHFFWQGSTPLHLAAEAGHAEVVALLVGRGMRLSVKCDLFILSLSHA